MKKNLLLENMVEMVKRGNGFNNIMSPVNLGI